MKALTHRILIIGTTPNALNSNWALRKHAATGFSEAKPAATIRECAWDEAYNAIDQFRPTLVIWMGGVMLQEYDLSLATHLARTVGSKVIFWMHDDPYELDVSLSIVELADFIFTTDKASQIHYPPNIPSFHLPLAACPYTHVRSITQRTGPEWFFCGVPFPCRTFFFTQVQKHGLDKKGLLLGPQWNLEKINSAADIPVSSGQIANYYSTARSVIYLGRDTDLANERFKVKPSTPGPRLFEAAMAGACQIALTPGLEIAEYFELESELILIDGVNDFSLVLSQLEVEPSLSEKIGKAAQERALKSHTYKHRALELIKQFEEAIV